MAEKEYILRDGVLAEYDRQHQGPPGGARKIIAEAPAADVVEVRHGQKIEITTVEDWCPWYKCSVCGYNGLFFEDNYCSHCGADMREAAPADNADDQPPVYALRDSFGYEYIVPDRIYQMLLPYMETEEDTNE